MTTHAAAGSELPLPSGWRWVRAKFLCDIETGTADTVDADPDGDYPFFVRSDIVERANTFTFDTEAVLTAGDGAGVGRVFHHFAGRFLAHQRVYVCSRFRGCLPRYYFYYFSTLFTTLVLAGTAKSTVESLRRPMLTDFAVAVPHPDDQRRIVGFLDQETAKIDALIAKQEHLIATLLERRRANSLSRTMEPAPEWARTRIGLALTKLERAPSDDAPVVTAYRDGQVTTRDSRREDGYTLSFTENNYQGVQQGDVVVHALDGFAGAVGVAEHSGKCTPVYHVCAPRTRNSAEYLALHIRMLGESGFLTAYAWSVRQRSVDYRNWS